MTETPRCTNCKGTGMDPRYSTGGFDCPDCQPPAPAPELREQVAAAIGRELGPGKGRDGGLLGAVPRITDAVLGVRDTELQQLREQLLHLRQESPWLRATAEDLAAARAAVARIARLAEEHPAGIDTALIHAALDGQAAEDPEKQQLRDQANGWRRKAIRRAIRLGRHETTLAALREFAAEEITARNGWGDGYRDAKRDLTELIDTLAPSAEPTALDQPQVQS